MSELPKTADEARKAWPDAVRQLEQEPLENMAYNECMSNWGSLCTARYRAMWIEILSLREKLAAPQEPTND